MTPNLIPEKVTHFYGCQLTTSNSVKEHKLRKLIAWLSDKQGRGKEFISLYIPGQSSVDEVIATFKKDTECAVNESSQVKERLQEAAKNVIQRLKLQKEVPKNGLAIFAGTFMENNLGTEILHVEELLPPQQINSYSYLFDDHFYLEPLREMLRDQRVIGLIAVDSKEASFGVSNGDRLELVETITSGVSGKSGKGGQSQRRYERERDMQVGFFFRRVAEHAVKAFLENHKITVLIVGGPGPTKNSFLIEDYLNYEIKNKLLNIVDTQSASQAAIREMLNKTSGSLMTMCGPEEKKTMQRLETELGKQSGLAIFGLDPVLEALKSGKVEVAIVTDSTGLIENVAICKKCGLTKEKILNKKDSKEMQQMISQPCEKCHSVEYEVVEKDMIEVLEDAAVQTNARVEVIFTESEEKAKLTSFSGFAAILRYKPENQ